MYVIPNYTFTVLGSTTAELVIPGVYGIERFVSIENATRNDVLYSSIGEHVGSITVSNDGLQTTVLIQCAEVGSKNSDKIRILIYDPSGGGVGPASNVAVTNWPASQNINGVVSISGEVEVKNDTGNPLPVSGTVSVDNFPATQAVTGTVTANQGTSPWVTSVNNFPATQSVTQGTTPWVVSGTTTSTVSAFPTTSTDAFNRLRVSQPFTMFDSSHRYSDNGLWATSTANGGAATFSTTEGLVNLSVDGTLGSRVYRETLKVFSYQPGKSLLVDNTFVFNTPMAGLRQRAGYYGPFNGYFLEVDGLDTYFVERSLSTASETRVLREDWNVDPMNGTGPSGITLDISKAQILWMDLQWLGEGTVRMGFEINGQAYLCHQWNHANLITSTYITTGSLPLRLEIENTENTGVTSTLKQVCSTVISEGGYTLTGLQQAVGTPIAAPYALAVAGTYYPLASVRLKTTRLDAIVILSAISLMGNGNNERFQWRVIASGTTTGGSWVSAGANSSVEYNLTGTATTGGRVLASGYTSSSNQGSPTIDILKQALFAFQLERNPFTATPYELTIALAGANNSTTAYASMDWEEVSR